MCLQTIYCQSTMLILRATCLTDNVEYFICFSYNFHYWQLMNDFSFVVMFRPHKALGHVLEKTASGINTAKIYMMMWSMIWNTVYKSIALTLSVLGTLTHQLMTYNSALWTYPSWIRSIVVACEYYYTFLLQYLKNHIHKHGRYCIVLICYKTWHKVYFLNTWQLHL